MGYKYTLFVVIAVTVGLILIGFVVGFQLKKIKDKTKPVQIPDTNETFLVQNNPNEPEWIAIEVAKRLSNLAKIGDTIVSYMQRYQLPDAEIAQRLASRWKTIRNNPFGLRETSKIEQTAAYTVNKGEELRICIRDHTSSSTNNNNSFQNENTGVMVLLHELAHLMSVTYGHNLEFKKNFAYITKMAVQLGLYNYIDYRKHPTNYCGTDITHPPFLIDDD